jgi:hypothetical protein
MFKEGPSHPTLSAKNIRGTNLVRDLYQNRAARRNV